MQVTDQDICVGDIVSFNAHMAATISVDSILLSGQDVKCDESALTGDPEPISKSAETLFMISGATVNAGNGTTLVIAVGDHSIAGKIKKSVYGEEGGELTPLYHKLDKMANQTGKAGLVGASIAMIARLVLGVWCSQETLLQEDLGHRLADHWHPRLCDSGGFTPCPSHRPRIDVEQDDEGKQLGQDPVLL